MGKKRERESRAKLRRNSRILAGLEANFVWVAVFSSAAAEPSPAGVLGDFSPLLTSASSSRKLIGGLPPFSAH
jgi:hypothetical protein